MCRVGKKVSSCGEKVRNWRKNKMHDMDVHDVQQDRHGISMG